MKNLILPCIFSLAIAPATVAQLPNWTQQSPANSPVGRQNSAMAFDSKRQRCVLFGAWDGAGRRNDTWEWDGTNWTEVITANKPTPRDAMCLAFDDTRDVVVCTAGYVSSSETWEYDGTDWTQVTTATTHTLGAHAVLAYDIARKVCVLYGTTASGPETWEYDGTDWKQVNTPNTPSGAGSMAYDSLRGVTVLVEGSRTWEYDGTDWTRINTATTPTGRCCGAGVVYDDTRKVIVMFGGGGGAQGSTWEFDGADWRENQTAAAPTAPRGYVAMAYDSARRRTVLFGGRDFSVTPQRIVGDTWEYAGRPCALIPDTHTIPIVAGGKQTLVVDGGPQRVGNIYWIFGSISGTSPGVRLNGVDIPLNPDAYTDLAIGAVNLRVLVNFNGVLGANGTATAELVLPPNVVPTGLDLHHAAVVYLGTWNCTTNPVLLRLQ